MSNKMHPVNKFLDFFGLKLIKQNSELANNEDKQLYKKIKDKYNVIWTGRSLIKLQEWDKKTKTSYNPRFIRDKNHVWMSYASRFNPSGKILDIASSLEWVAGLAATKKDLTYVEIRDHYLKEIFPFKYVVSDAAKMPFQDEEFDDITFWQLLHHVGCLHGQEIDFDKPRLVVKEISRVLKKNGRGFCVTLIKDGEGILPFGYSRIFGLEEIRHIFTQSGLKITKEIIIDGKSFEEKLEPIKEISEDTNFHRFIGDFGVFELIKD